MATRIQGIEGMKHGELEFALQRGAKFVLLVNSLRARAAPVPAAAPIPAKNWAGVVSPIRHFR
jgi:hypothetical protein